MRVVPAKNGWFWLLKGFALFRKSPVMWLFLVFTYWIAVALLGQIRYLGLATLIALGVLYLLSVVAVLGIASLADAGALLQWVFYGQEPPQEGLRDGSVSRALVFAALAGAPVLMAFWFAPVLAAWNRMGAAQSLFYSFFAVWRNWRAFVVYGAALALAGLAFITAVTAAAIATSGQVEVRRFLGLIFTMLTLPTLFASFYASYRDIFPHDPVPADQPSNATGP